MVKDLASKYQIKHRKYTPYHPQANGQVESTSKTLEADSPNTQKRLVRQASRSIMGIQNHL
jgi:hypothetical protein